jgi:hypothetical protein
MGDQLKLGDVRRVFRLVGEIRELGADPERWRPHMVQALRKLARAEVVVSSEIHFRKIKTTGAMKVFDLGWGSDPEGKSWKIQTEREDEKPENFWLAAASADAELSGGRGLGSAPSPAPVKTTSSFPSGRPRPCAAGAS